MKLIAENKAEYEDIKRRLEYHTKNPTYCSSITSDLYNALQLGGWIKIADRQPKDDTRVIVFFDGVIETRRYKNGIFIPENGYKVNAKYWQPLPEKPEGDICQ